MYKPTNIELKISKMLKSKGITKKEHLNIETLAKAFNIEVRYCDLETVLMTGKRGALIIVDNKIPKKEQYFQFLNTLSKYMLNNFPCLNNYDWKYIELKVEFLVRYIAIPYFLIKESERMKNKEKLDVTFLSDYFSIPCSVIEKRLEEFTNRQTIHFVS